jgi:hypothetical protein
MPILNQISLYAVGCLRTQDSLAWDMGVRFQDGLLKEGGLGAICVVIFIHLSQALHILSDILCYKLNR